MATSTDSSQLLTFDLYQQPDEIVEKEMKVAFNELQTEIGSRNEHDVSAHLQNQASEERREELLCVCVCVWY
jgi:hypothetical protein